MACPMARRRCIDMDERSDGRAGNSRPHRDGPPLVSLSTLVELLTSRIDALVPELLPLGKRHGSEWVEASSARGGLGDSLSVKMMGARAGIWGHFATGQRGDLLDLIAYVRCGGDKSAAIRWAKDWLGHGVAGGGIADPAALARARKARERREQTEASDRARRSAHAAAMWLSAPKVKPDDVVDRYLAGRGIGLLQLGLVPGCLHAGQRIHHPDGSDWPAMLACVLDPDGKQVATHRTWLTEDGRKAPVDADLPPAKRRAKMVLGSYQGGYIPLWKGEHRQTLRALPEGVPVYVSEGIEDGLSAARLLPKARIIAAISLSNMLGLWLPPQVRDVVFIGQNDKADSEAARFFARAVQAHADKGRTVRVALPPAGIKDFNDWVRMADANKGGERVA
jgi:hypothetical protein